MFLGTSPAIISQYVIEQIRKMRPGRVFVPFAGNFVIEQLCGIVDKEIEVFSSDISTYSRCIGHGVQDEVTEIRLKPEVVEDFPVFAGELSPMQLAVAAIFMSEAALYKMKGHKTCYYRKLYQSCVDNQKEYYDGISKKLEEFRSKLGKFSFHGMCGLQLLDKADVGDLVFFDPPFISDSYDKQFEALNGCFEYREPIFTYMTEEVKRNALKSLHKKGVRILYRPENPLADDDPLRKFLTESYRYRHTYDANYCIYSNVEAADRFVGTFTPIREEVKNYPILKEEDEITSTSKIELVSVSNKIANHYRLLWIKKARMKDNGKSYMVLCDGKVVGIVQLGTGQTFGNEFALINSDPATPTSRYKRLGKLLLRVINTKEFLDRYSVSVLWEHKGFTTKAYSNEAASMKYRGVFDLHERKDMKGKANYRFELTYRSKEPLPTIQDALNLWLERDSNALNITTKPTQ